MSDSEHSMVTYTEVSSEFGGSCGSSGRHHHRITCLAPEELRQAPPSPVYLLPATVLPIADSPGHITESYPEEDSEEEDDEDPEEDPADYPTDRDDEEEEEESSRDYADDEEEDEGEDEEEKEEHLAPVDSVPPPAYHTTTRMSIRAQTPIPFPSEAEIPSPPLPVSSPLPISPPPLPASSTHPLGYRAAMIRLRAEVATPSTYCLASPSGTPPSGTPPSGTPPILPIPLPTSSPPFLLPSTDYRENVPEVMLPPRMRLCIALGPRYEIEECSSAPTARPTRGFRADYGFVGTMDAEIRRVADLLAERNTTRSINGEDSHDSSTGVRRQASLARECTYPDFMKCKPLYFKGTEGVVELTQLFERMQTVFRISNCTVEN
ncbi:hypothetical protein Tco_0627518 [Tanacetum coccineum]|uniref:Uncharacterized protein n=1 Tax=Tanacetum coccineum TaxID=301880 RepID=A0ABQ4WMQ8_9ASTR